MHFWSTSFFDDFPIYGAPMHHQCTKMTPKWCSLERVLTLRIILVYKKCILDALQFLVILHFLVLQCTTNGANLPSYALISNLHALRSILNPIITPLETLHFEIRVLYNNCNYCTHSTFHPQSVIIFGFLGKFGTSMQNFSV